jgi:hypothetical protein
MIDKPAMSQVSKWAGEAIFIATLALQAGTTTPGEEADNEAGDTFLSVAYTLHLPPCGASCTKSAPRGAWGATIVLCRTEAYAQIL